MHLLWMWSNISLTSPTKLVKLLRLDIASQNYQIFTASVSSDNRLIWCLSEYSLSAKIVSISCKFMFSLLVSLFSTFRQNRRVFYLKAYVPERNAGSSCLFTMFMDLEMSLFRSREKSDSAMQRLNSETNRLAKFMARHTILLRQVSQSRVQSSIFLSSSRKQSTSFSVAIFADEELQQQVRWTRLSMREILSLILRRPPWVQRILNSTHSSFQQANLILKSASLPATARALISRCTYYGCGESSTFLRCSSSSWKPWQCRESSSCLRVSAKLA